MSALPPDFDPGRLNLREASEDEKIQSWRNNSEAWHGKLNVEQHIQLQAVNGDQDLTRNGGIRYWVLTDGVEIYCSVETIRKPIIASGQAQSSPGREWAWGIAAVFTPVRYRRRGVASAMMRKLAVWLDNEDAKSQYAVLYSAVGSFYTSFGWRVIPTRELRISTNASESSIGLQPIATPLNRQILRQLCEDDVQDLCTKLTDTSLLEGSQIRLAFLPTYDQATWHFGAEEYIATQLFAGRTPSVKGAMSASGRIWCYWVHDFNSDRLTILRLVWKEEIEPASGKAGSPLQIGAVLRAAVNGVIMWGLRLVSKRDQVSASIREGSVLQTEIGEVLRAAMVEAAKWELRQVALWDPDPRVIAACSHVLKIEPIILEEIEGYLPCLRWKGRDGTRGASEELDWTLRDAYPRC